MPIVTDATVAAQAYDTSGNGGRKLVQLNDKSLVAAFKSQTQLFTYRTIDNWNTKTEIWASNVLTSTQDIALATDGERIFRLIAFNNNSVSAQSFDKNGISISGTVLDSANQTALGNVSLAINETKTELHAAWASKNGAYPNSFNIRYAKGTINADGTVTWGSVEQVTTVNQSGWEVRKPSISVDSQGVPFVVVDSTYAFNLTGPGSQLQYPAVQIFKRDSSLSKQNTTVVNSNWSVGEIYVSIGASYSQSTPSAIYVPQSINGLASGLIANAWHGTDSTNSGVHYIRFSKSTDGGINWSTMQKLVPGTNASLTANKAGKLFITYEDGSITKRIESTDKGDNWSSPITVGTGTNPSTLFDLNMAMSAPLTIRKGASSVLFSGAWTVTTISITPGDIGKRINSEIMDLGVFTFDTNISNYIAGQSYTFTVNSAYRTAFTKADVKQGDYITNVEVGGLTTPYFVITAINGYTLTVKAMVTITDLTPPSWSDEHIVRPDGLLSYAITTDGAMSTITEKVNGTTVNTRTATSGQDITVGLTQAQWDAIRFGRYADATGGKNTLTVEMGTEKWTYTFDKRLATDADILSATKAVKDTNEVYLPSVKKQLADAINTKGGSASASDSLEVLASKITSSTAVNYKTGQSISPSTAKSFTTSTGSVANSAYVSIDFSQIGFSPKYILIKCTDLSGNITSTVWSSSSTYVSGVQYSNVITDTSRFRSPATIGITDIPVVTSSISYTWEAYQ